MRLNHDRKWRSGDPQWVMRSNHDPRPQVATQSRDPPGSRGQTTGPSGDPQWVTRSNHDRKWRSSDPQWVMRLTTTHDPRWRTQGGGPKVADPSHDAGSPLGFGGRAEPRRRTCLRVTMRRSICLGGAVLEQQRTQDDLAGFLLE